MFITVKTGSQVLMRAKTKLETIKITSLNAKLNNVKNKRFNIFIICMLLISESFWSNVLKCFKTGLMVTVLIVVCTINIEEKIQNLINTSLS